MDEQELMKHLREAFRMESEERLVSIAENLMLWEKSSDGSHEENVEIIYRDFHSLKGASRAVDYLEVESVCQLAESFLSLCKNKNISVKREHFDLLHQLVRYLERMMEAVDQESESLLSEAQLLKGAFEEILSSDLSDENVTELTSDTVLSEEEFVADKEVVELNSGIEENESILREKRDFKEEKTPEMLESNMENDSPDFNLSRSVRIGTDKLDAFLYKTEELISLKLSRISDFQDLKSIPERFVQINKLLQTSKQSLNFVKRREISGVESNQAFHQLERIEESQDLLKTHIDELGAQIQKLMNRQAEAVVQTDEMVTGLMDVVKKSILQPASNLLQLLSRTIRELASQSNKEVLVEQEGVDVTIDRRILEELQAALIHLVRNCVDHGIETSEERLAQGKASQGTIRISFIKEEDIVHICISDDGRGIDYEKIREKAVKLKLYTEDEAQHLDRPSLHSLIFDSGFSTAPIITEISGRGLGLSIVKEHIEKIGGHLYVDSEFGLGTRFKMSIPISMSSMRGIVFILDAKHFAIPLSHVEQTMRIDASMLMLVEGKTSIRYEGRAIALVSLAELLQLKQSKNRKGLYQVLIVESGSEKIALIVDQVLGVQELLLKPLGKQLKRVKNISGVTILGDGSMAPVIHTADLFKALSSGMNANVNTEEDTDSLESQKKLLVVEDSITSRILLKNVLESAGYYVDTAVDGQEGLEKMKSNTFDLMVSDIEMPKMNGYSLTKLVKEDLTLKDTPVILVTSLGSQEDKEKGIEVGADAHIVKSQFDQTALLDTIERLI